VTRTPDPTPPDPTWRPPHPLTPTHLERAQIAAARVRRGMRDPAADPLSLFPVATGAGKLGGIESHPPRRRTVADEVHPRFCLVCGGRPDAAGFVMAVVARLGIPTEPLTPPSLRQLVTGEGGRRLAEEARRHARDES
jgi:hypothetical protein